MARGPLLGVSVFSSEDTMMTVPFAISKPAALRPLLPLETRQVQKLPAGMAELGCLYSDFYPHPHSLILPSSNVSNLSSASPSTKWG